MLPRSALMSLLIVFCSLCIVRGDDNELNNESVSSSLLPQKIGEQIHQFFYNLQFRPLGSTPLEIGLKVTLNALEIFAIASGVRLFAPKTGLDDAAGSIHQDYYTNILASTNLCTNLTTLREMHKAICNATLFVGAEMLLDPSGVFIVAPERFYEVLDKFASADPELKQAYQEEKRRIHAAGTLPPLTRGTIDFERIVPLEMLPKLLELFEGYPRFRYFLVNTLFAWWTSEKLASGHGSLHKHHELATSLMKLSIESRNPDKVQKLFDEAIRRTAAQLDPANVNFATILQISESLSSALLQVSQSIQLENEGTVVSRATNDN